MALLVIRPGLSTTVQDRGRFGYRGFGVPVGGAFDRGSLDLANALLGNEPDAAALEMTLVGGTYRAEVTLAIALAGAPMSATVRAATGSDRTLVVPQATTLKAGEELVIGGSPFGARTYLAVRGGWQTALVLASRSSETRLEPGVRLLADSRRDLDSTTRRLALDHLGRPRTHPDRRRPRRGARRRPNPGVGRVSCASSFQSNRMGAEARRPADPSRKPNPTEPRQPVAARSGPGDWRPADRAGCRGRHDGRLLPPRPRHRRRP